MWLLNDLEYGGTTCKVAFHLSGPTSQFLHVNGHTSSQDWFWPEWPSWIKAAHGLKPLNFPALPKRGNLESYGGKNVHVCACLGPFHLNWSEPVLCSRPEWSKFMECDLRLVFTLSLLAYQRYSTLCKNCHIKDSLPSDTCMF